MPLNLLDQMANGPGAGGIDPYAPPEAGNLAAPGPGNVQNPGISPAALDAYSSWMGKAAQGNVTGTIGNGLDFSDVPGGLAGAMGPNSKGEPIQAPIPQGAPGAGVGSGAAPGAFALGQARVGPTPPPGAPAAPGAPGQAPSPWQAFQGAMGRIHGAFNDYNAALHGQPTGLTDILAKAKAAYQAGPPKAGPATSGPVTSGPASPGAPATTAPQTPSPNAPPPTPGGPPTPGPKAPGSA